MMNTSRKQQASTDADSIGETAHTLAKITRPQTHQPLLRPRLLERIHSLRHLKLIWIAAAPGSGKTTLVSSYLQQYAIPHLWYRLDSGDSDLASFFHYLGMAIEQLASSGDPPLPALTPEFMPGVLTFTRRYAEAISHRLQPQSILVLDNYETIAPDSLLHEVIYELSTSLHQGMTVLLLSQTEPPPSYAKLQLYGELTIINNQELSLTRHEAEAFAAIRAPQLVDHQFASDRIERLLNETCGWIAGFTLLLIDETASTIDEMLEPAEGRQIVFDYFATELFSQFNPSIQLALMKAALLPAMSVADAQTLSGETHIADVLAQMQQRNLFIAQLNSNPAIYEFHPLFREFLLKRGAECIAHQEWRELQRIAGTLNEDQGLTFAAAELYRVGEHWPELAQLVLREAPILIGAGRNQTLEQWLLALPQACLALSPWLVYWSGLAQLANHPAQARRLLEQAYADFNAGEDVQGIYSAWASIMDSFFYEWRDFNAVDHWIAEMEALQRRYGGFPSPMIERRVYSTLLTLIYRQPQHPFVSQWIARALDLWDQEHDDDFSIPLGCCLNLFFLWQGTASRSWEVITRLQRSGQALHASPMRLILSHVTQAMYHGVRGDAAACRISVEAGLALAEHTGLRLWNFMLYGIAAQCALAGGNVLAAESHLAGMTRFMYRAGLEQAFYHMLKAGIAELQGAWRLASEHARIAANIATAAGTPFQEAHCRSILATNLVQQDQYHEVNELIAAVRSTANAMGSLVLEYKCLMIEASAAYKQDDDRLGLAKLTQALALSRHIDGTTWETTATSIRSKLYCRALAAGIEVEHVRSIILRHQLPPPDPATTPDNWPWPLRLYTFGRLELLQQELPLQTTGKAQHKPLELLKCLCAFGGHAVNQDRLCDALWPDAQGDTAEQAFKTTLHRLRKLLDKDQSIVLQDRHLSINARYLWVDCLAFERAANHPQMTDLASLKLALSRYRGHFLVGETTSWALLYREKLRAHFLSLCAHTAALLENSGDTLAAINCYQKGIGIEPATEVFYRNLMLLYLQNGQRTEALSTYQRCRQTLINQFGISPSTALQDLYRSLCEE